MDSNLVRKYANGRKDEKQLAAAAQPIVDEARLAALRIDGSMAVAGHAMDAVVKLDTLRRDLAGGDPVLNQLMADLELEAVRQVKKEQSSLYGLRLT
jgi:enamine deaminase RidA (YjgF/YER057c/UK114 family)